MDIELIRFYNSIKDPSWPTIQNYIDYHLLPAYIKEECDKLHNFQQRKTQLYDVNYWTGLSVDVYYFENLAYVPVPKCATYHHLNLFHSLGWEKTILKNLDIENMNFFGLIMDPMRRRLKGITQWILDCYQINDDANQLPNNSWEIVKKTIDWKQLKSDMQTKYINRLMTTTIVADIHSIPYTSMFGNFLDKINWIPMDLLDPKQIKISMMHFFRLHGHKIQLPLEAPPTHVSSKNQIEVYNFIKQAFIDINENLYYYYRLYGNDIRFYYNLIDKFTPDWQHLNKN